ncbi:unnamed protein product [Rotaria sordida]|uniref:Glucose-6-phosphate 1-dehydrogenase n=1 Tax=Rotaria sordida TaxID=392033 RepID=A0A814SQ65_9BILA|nr:unnamed protein product [Rotaria sordida]
MNATADVKYDLNTTSIGVLIFTQDNADSPVKITGTLTGLYSNASLGFHIHQSSLTGNIPNCTAAGAHFNPYNVGHGARNGTICTRHVGDLGNIQTDENGTITIDISDSIIQLYNNTARSIINLPVVVHTQMDDLGTGTSPNSTTTGESISRQDSFGLTVKETVGYVYQRLRAEIFGNQSDTGSISHIFFVFGASGDLAKKKIYPTLWALYRDELLPEHIRFIGYARSEITIEKIFENAAKYMKVKENEHEKYEKFVKINSYIAGSYDNGQDFENLNIEANKLSKQDSAHRLFYLALPPSVYESVTELISKYCRPKSPGWLRLIVEKPFGKDLTSSNKLSLHLKKFFTEEEIYRIDHYLGKEMVQNIIVLRFANQILSRVWNRDSIATVSIIFKEDIGTQGRGGYFDEFGIIRDVIQNHLMQILSIIAMEKPRSTKGEDIRDEKVKLLRSVVPIKLEDVVIGQYIGDKDSTDVEHQQGYLDDKGVPKDSTTPTYAQVVLKINNERWAGVPFILRAGKALSEKKAEVRIQFHDTPGKIFDTESHPNTTLARDELVIRVQPNEAIYLKINTKQPGKMSFNIEETELDLTYGERYKDIQLPDAYERLILDVFMGSKINFVRSDELQEAWRILDPILAEIDKKKIPTIPYTFGSPGIQQAFDIAAKYGYIFRGTYVWKNERSALTSNKEQTKTDNKK